MTSSAVDRLLAPTAADFRGFPPWALVLGGLAVTFGAREGEASVGPARL